MSFGLQELLLVDAYEWDVNYAIDPNQFMQKLSLVTDKKW